MKEYDTMTTELAEFISKQHMFFVGTAPPIVNGHVNVSPKGLRGSFKLISHAAALAASKGLYSVPALAYFAYIDIGGSGIETHSHLQTESKSITVCFCAFEGPPKILRLFGRGVSVEPGEQGWDELLNEFDSDLVEAYKARGHTPSESKIRNIVVVEVQRIRDSCGYGVPLLNYNIDRDIFPKYNTTKPDEVRISKRKENNKVSIDGLPGLRWVQDGAKPPSKPEMPISIKSIAVNASFFIGGVVVALLVTKSKLLK